MNKILLLGLSVLMTGMMVNANAQESKRIFNKEEIKSFGFKTKEEINTFENIICYVYFENNLNKKLGYTATQMDSWVNKPMVDVLKKDKEKLKKVQDIVNMTFNDFTKNAKDDIAHFMSYNKDYSQYKPTKETEEYFEDILDEKLETPSFTDIEDKSSHKDNHKIFEEVCVDKIKTQATNQEIEKSNLLFKERLNNKFENNYEIKNFIK